MDFGAASAKEADPAMGQHLEAVLPASCSSDSDAMTPKSFDNTHVVGDVSQECEISRLEKQGAEAFRRLGWKRLTVVLIVEAIALGSLSLPGVFHTLGMIAGVILTVGIGLIAMYTSYVVGQVKLKFPSITHYADAGRLMFGRWGYEVIGVMFALQLTLITASHVLTGKIMWGALTDDGACSVVFGVVSAIILFLVAIPPSFAELAILGYIDFVSILAAIGITMIATGIRAGDAAGGLASVDWSAYPKPDLTLAEAFIAIANIVFAYSFAMCQYSFMDEMHTPSDFPKSILALGVIEILIYTLTGAIIYAFVGADVQSPALLSAGATVSKVAFGVALPVIFISGSINTVVVSRYIINRAFPNSIIRYVNTPKGWMTWLGIDAAVTVLAWVIAEAIPFFSALLAISSSLFVTGFSFYFPAIMWFMFIRDRDGGWLKPKTLALAILNGLCFVIGVVILGFGTYASIQDIVSLVPLFSFIPCCSVSPIVSLLLVVADIRLPSSSTGTAPEPCRIPSPALPCHSPCLLFFSFFSFAFLGTKKDLCGKSRASGESKKIAERPRYVYNVLARLDFLISFLSRHGISRLLAHEARLAATPRW